MKVECTQSLNNLYFNFHWKLVKINGQKYRTNNQKIYEYNK